MRQLINFLSKTDGERPALFPLIIILGSLQAAALRPSPGSIFGLLFAFFLFLFIIRQRSKALRIFWIVCFIYLLLFIGTDRLRQIRLMQKADFSVPQHLLIRAEKVSYRPSEDYVQLRARVEQGPAAGLRFFLSGPCRNKEAIGSGRIYELKAESDRLGAARLPGEYKASEQAVKEGVFLKLRFKKDSDLQEVAEESSAFLKAPLLKLRGRIEIFRHKLSARYIALCGPPAGGLAAAMVYGDKSVLPRATEEIFRSYGLTHILVTSGTHVSLCLDSFRPLGRHLLPQRRQRLFFQLFLLLLLSALSLAAPAILRASLMKVLEIRDALRDRRSLKDNYLYTSVLLMALLNPYFALNQGFLMSVMAAQAVYLVPPLEERGREQGWRYYLKEMGRKLSMYLRIQLFLLPFMWQFGREFTLSQIAANLFLLPLANLLLRWSFFFLLLGHTHIPAAWLGHGLRAVYGLLMYLFSVGSRPQLPSFRLSRKHIIGLPLLLGLLLFYLRSAAHRAGQRKSLSKRRVWRLLLPATLAAFCCARLSIAALDGIYFLDVGQGDATLLRNGKTAILIDGGPPGQGARLEQFLHNIEVEQLDLVLVTHLDSDHKGGVLDLLDRGFPIRELALPDQAVHDEAYPQFLEDIRSKQKETLSLRFLRPGDRIMTEPYKLTVHGPLRLYEERNDNSLVLCCDSGRHTILFTGDAGFAAEEDMLAADCLGPCDILHVSHHGARNGTSPALLQKVCPSQAVISCGFKNRYGHPHPVLLARLNDISLPFRTDYAGSFFLKLRGRDKRLKVLCPEHYLPASYAKMMGMEAADGG